MSDFFPAFEKKMQHSTTDLLIFGTNFDFIGLENFTILGW